MNVYDIFQLSSAISVVSDAPKMDGWMDGWIFDVHFPDSLLTQLGELTLVVLFVANWWLRVQSTHAQKHQIHDPLQLVGFLHPKMSK